MRDSNHRQGTGGGNGMNRCGHGRSSITTLDACCYKTKQNWFVNVHDFRINQERITEPCAQDARANSWEVILVRLSDTLRPACGPSRSEANAQFLLIVFWAEVGVVKFLFRVLFSVCENTCLSEIFEGLMARPVRKSSAQAGTNVNARHNSCLECIFFFKHIPWQKLFNVLSTTVLSKNVLR